MHWARVVCVKAFGMTGHIYFLIVKIRCFNRLCRKLNIELKIKIKIYFTLAIKQYFEGINFFQTIMTFQIVIAK